MKKRTYKVNLRGIDTKKFEQNPLVLRRWYYEMSEVIGTARILPYKVRVEVTYSDDEPSYDHTLGTSIARNNYEQPYLVGLATIPVLRS